MTDSPALTPAKQLASTNKVHDPSQSTAHRTACNAPIAEQVKLRCHVERVTVQRRALPAGGEIPQALALVPAVGLPTSSGLCGDLDRLLVYSISMVRSAMHPAQCAPHFSRLRTGVAVNLRRRVVTAGTARSPIERLLACRQQRGFAHLVLSRI